MYALGRFIYPARCHETAAVDPHKVLELRFREYEKKGTYILNYLLRVSDAKTKRTGSNPYGYTIFVLRPRRW